jgi:hypothetical protein
MSKDFQKRERFIESCNSLMLELENENLNENIISNFANQLFDNIKTTKEIADFYKKLLTNNNALQYYLTQIKDSIIRNINKINNNYLDKLLTTLNNTASLKNLVYLSVLACATSFYIINYTKIPDLVKWFVEILNSQVLNSITIDNIIQFFEMLIKIVGSIVFVYKVLIEPYKNQIISMVGKFNLNKQNTMTESKFTNYNKRKMNKVLINESQLRAMVRKMLMEQTPMGSTPVGSTGFAPQGTAPSSLATNASKQSTTLQSQRNTQQNKTLTQVDNLVKLNGQFINMMNGVNKEKINPSKFNKQTLITNFTKLLTDLGYK